MLLYLRTLAVSSILTCAAANLLPRQDISPGPVNGDTFIHDPTVVKTPKGSYIAAYTGDNVQLKTSTDRITWKNAGPVFPNGASWTTPYTKGSRVLWAPDISYHNGQYWLYYSASTFGTSHSAIFLATSKTGRSGSWTNQGVVVASTVGSDYNAIDGNLLVTAAGEWYLSFGSFSSGIKLITLDPQTGLRSGRAVTSLAARPHNGGAVEAPFIVQRGGFYYLWVSFDRCCRGAQSTYRTMVGRATELLGPYVDQDGRAMMEGGGTPMLSSHGPVHGPGHSAVLADADGDVLVYHYYRNDGLAQLGINLIRYDDGWPVIY
ncbi:arabinan endo-1,5-alpha-L-arabinosidase A [Diplocarpon rosae]|nr:arabinan endo-1,5-alpha-L-arabinosidase A [Diplocarpon rosae]